MNLQTINKNKLLEQLNEQFGIKEIPENTFLIKLGEEKIFAFSGDLKLLWKLEKLNINIAGVGNYVAKEERGQLRLSIEGTHLFKNQINKNIFELNKEQKDLWMHGSQLDIETNKRGFLIMKYEDDFLGTGKASENKIGNFIPKNRRLKHKEY